MASLLTDIRCGREHAAPILAIFNEAIANGTALWEYEPRTMASMDVWFETKNREGWPVLGITDTSSHLLAFGTYGTFRAREAYKYTVEHSVYVEKGAQGQGLGRRILVRLIKEAQAQGFHTLVGGIDATNVPSIKLHVSLGFTNCGEVRQAGFKFGRWLDLAFYQLILPTPAKPTDGKAR